MKYNRAGKSTAVDIWRKWMEEQGKVLPPVPQRLGIDFWFDECATVSEHAWASLTIPNTEKTHSAVMDFLK